jgi:RNA polymerase sigma-70 factor (ECF subfamily)
MTTLLTEVHAEEPAAGPDQPPGDEPRLVRDAVGGDAQAFEQIVRLHHRRVFTFLLQMTRQRQDAEDLAQQTFIKAYHHLARFDPGRPLINWLLVIARRTALNHFRAAKKWEEIPEETAGGEPSPARSAEDQDHADTLWARARAVLSPREFEVLWLRFAEDFSTKETARIVGLTETHVKVLVFRARQTLLKGETTP